MHDIVSPKFFPPLFDWQEERKRECGKFVLICSTQFPLFLLPNPTPPWFSVLLGHPEGSDHSGGVQHCLEQYNSATLQVLCCIERWVVISRELPSLGEDLGDWANVSGSHRFVHMVTQSHRGSHSEALLCRANSLEMCAQWVIVETPKSREVDNGRVRRSLREIMALG